jgi:hypothetical protein
MVQIPGQQMGGGLDNFYSSLTKAGVLFVGIPFAISRTLVQGSIGIIRAPAKVAANKTGIQSGLKWYGYVRRPVLSFGVRQGVPGARPAMFLSKTYAATMLGIGIYEIDKNLALYRNKDWDRLGISLGFPPGSLWIYDRFIVPKVKSPPTSSSPSQQNGVGGGTQNNSNKNESPSSSSDRTPFIRRHYATKSRRKIWCSRHNKSDYCYRRKKNR